MSVVLALVVALAAMEKVVAQTAPQDGPIVRSYRVSPEQEGIVRRLADQWSNDPLFRHVYDPPTAQWLVVAPATTHQQIALHLTPLDTPPTLNAPTTPASGLAGPIMRLPPVEAAAPAKGRPQPPTAKTLQLRQLTAETLHARLEKVLQRRLPIERDASGHWQLFAVGAQEGQPVTIWANDQNQKVQLQGRADQVRSWQQIVEALDSPPNATTTTQLVVTQPGAKTQIQQAVDALGRSRLVGQTVSSDTSRQNANQTSPAEATTPIDKENKYGSLLGPVQIEFVENTGILVLRGNPRDVQRVMEVIQEIERLAAISEPRIQIIELQHVESQALAPLLLKVFDESLSPGYGYGKILVVPLVKPNSVLLVGLPQTVDKAIGILQQLDQPGKALTQFEVFRLKHAKAADARLVVENLFLAKDEETTPTLKPTALVISDSRTNMLIVRAGPRDMNEVRTIIQELDRAASDAVNEIRVFRLKNSVATDLAKVLQESLQGKKDDDDQQSSLSSLLELITIDAEGKQKLESGVLADARVTADSSANALVVSAPADSMPLLTALIEQLDQDPDVSAELKVFTIVNGDAKSLSEMLQGLFGDSNQQQQGQRRRQQGGRGGGAQQSGLFNLRFTVDERTNSIIAAGSGEDLLVVEAILLRLDSSSGRQRENHVYRLKNKSAEDVAQALQEWLRREREVQGTAPGVTSPFQQIEREVVVVPELSSNSLIVSATPRYYGKIEPIIQQLDEQAPMVMIQVLIGEVQLGDTDEFGIELGLQDSALFDRSLLQNLETTSSSSSTPSAGGAITLEQQIIQSADLTPGFDFGSAASPLGNSGSDTSLATAGRVAAQSLSSFAMGRVGDAGFGGLVLSASSDSVSMLLRALQESRRLEVLSRPQIMALDNQEGEAFVGERVPYILGSQTDPSGVRTNNIELIDVGLSLLVRPRISPDDLVVMEVTALKSELGAISEGVPVSIAPNGDAVNAPRIREIRAKTTISAMSGQTVVLSGLLTKSNETLNRRVPLLADIPLLGNLFRFDSVRTRRTELLIILTPHVVHNRFEAEMIKQVESARMSWVLGDVIDLNGPVGLRSRDDTFGAAEAEAFYPEQVPSEQLMPTSEPLLETPTEPPSAPSDPTTSGKGKFSLSRLFSKSSNEEAEK